jgi:hypothetical protein
MIETPRPTNADEIVDAYLRLARYSIGLSGSRSREAFADLLAPRTLPNADPKRIAANAGSRKAICHLLQFPFSTSLPINRRGISTCGMTCEGQDAWMCVDADCLYAPYIWGTSVSRAIAYYSKHGAWTYADKADPADRPPLAAYVVIGLTQQPGKPPNDYGGLEHAFRIVEQDLDADTFVSADGGSVEASTGLQCVKEVHRRWEVRRGHPWLVDPVSGKGRRVLGWGDVTLLRFREGLGMLT